MGVAALMVAACSSQPSEPIASDRTASARHPTPRAGRYEVTQIDYELGGANTSMVQPVVLNQCISVGEAADAETLLAGPSLPGCPDRTVKLNEGHIDLAFQCQDPVGSIAGNGSYSDGGWEVAVDLNVQGQAIRFEEKAQRIGDC
jgi:hypothetical protein